MTETTLGRAHHEGWRVRVRCAQGKRAGMKSIAECTNDAYLDLASLVWTRGRNFPIAMLAERLRDARRAPAVSALRVAPGQRHVLPA